MFHDVVVRHEIILLRVRIVLYKGPVPFRMRTDIILIKENQNTRLAFFSIFLKV